MILGQCHCKFRLKNTEKPMTIDLLLHQVDAVKCNVNSEIVKPREYITRVL